MAIRQVTYLGTQLGNVATTLADNGPSNLFKSYGQQISH